MQKRMLNYRESFDLIVAEGMNITVNYYPVTSAIAIKDSNL
jgi:hypothetical protein